MTPDPPEPPVPTKTVVSAINSQSWSIGTRYNGVKFSDDTEFTFSNPYVSTLEISGSTNRYFYLKRLSDNYYLCMMLAASGTTLEYVYNPTDDWWYTGTTSTNYNTDKPTNKSQSPYASMYAGLPDLISLDEWGTFLTGW